MTVGRGVLWKKNSVDDARCLDMATFARDIDLEKAAEGYTSWHNNRNVETGRIGWEVCPPYRLRLYYSVTKRDGQRDDYDYYVRLDTTPCYFGGKRWWFLCPNTTCGRRCRILYLAPGSPYFACRVCHNLTYRSQQEGQNKWDRVMRYLLRYPELQRRFYRTRSPRKQASLFKKIVQLANGAKRTTDEKRAES